MHNQTFAGTFYFLLRLKEIKMFFRQIDTTKEEGVIRVDFNLDQLD